MISIIKKMSTLGNFKDVPTIASVSALVAVGVSTSYFLSEIGKIKEDVATIKEHLLAIMPHVNPNTGKRLDIAMKDIQAIDSKVSKALGEISVLNKHMGNDQPPKRTYERFTKKIDIQKPTLAIRPVAKVIPADGNEYEDDIAAMS